MTLTADKEETVAKKQTSRKMGVGATFGANLKLVCDVRHKPAEQVMEYMGICRATYYDRMNHPERWTASNMDSAAKLFEIPVGDMVSRMLRPEEVS